tara:strand:+ start:293 stop:712 length:420 start_codon:yes stop_codon:yes gene_type:complete
MCRASISETYIMSNWNMFWVNKFGSELEQLLQWCDNQEDDCLFISNVRVVRTAIASACRRAHLLEFTTPLNIFKSPSPTGRIIVSPTSELIGCHLHHIKAVAWADDDPVSQRAKTHPLISVLGVTFSHNDPIDMTFFTY